jgi:hypothetical protein
VVTDSREVRSARPRTAIVAGLAAWVLRPTGVGGAFVGWCDVCGRSALRVVRGWPVLVAFVAVRTVVIIAGGIPRASRVLEEAEVLSSASGVHARLSPQASVSRGTGSRRWGCRASPGIPRRLVGNPPT